MTAPAEPRSTLGTLAASGLATASAANDPWIVNLRRTFRNVRPDPDDPKQYLADCPASPPGEAPHRLRITRDANGRDWCSCTRGCSQQQITRALAPAGDTEAGPRTEPKAEPLRRPEPRERDEDPLPDRTLSVPPAPASSSPLGLPVAKHDYQDESGALLFQAIRFEPPGKEKTFRQRHRGPDGKWIWNIKDVRHVLFRLPELLDADPVTPVFVVEGEKDVLRLVGLGLVATTNPMGAGKWRRDYNEALRGRHVIILPDNDDPGRKHADQVAAALQGVAASIRIPNLPGLPPKGDVSDWLNAGGTEKELERLAAETPEWSPPDEPEPAPRKPHRQASATRPRPRPQHGAPARYCQQALESEIEDLRATHEGRNNRLTRAAFVLGQLVAPGQLDRQDVEGCLLEACRGNGSLAEHGEAKCRDTIRRGLDDGLTQPRVIPRTSHHPQDAVAPEPVGRQTPDTESPAWTSSDQRPVGQSPQAGAPQDLRTPTLQVLDLAGLLAVYRRWLYLPDEDPLYAALATVAANRALDGDPVWLLVVGTPGSGKTESIQPLVSLPDVHPAGTLTEASLLSGTPRKDHGAGSKGGLLRAIGERGILLCKDFGSIFSLNRDAAAGIMAALREIFDGAWTRHVGTDGGKTLEWKGRLGLIGGCTPTLDRQHSVMASLGERFLFVRFRDAGTRDHARSALRHAGKETAMRRELDAAVTGFFASLPPMKGVEPITSEETETLLDLCALVARCRSSVERNAYGREIELIPGAESPTRLTVTCLRLFSGLVAIGTPREGAWRVVRRVALDSMPALRFRVIRELFKMEKAGWRTPEGAVPNTQESEGAGTGAISRALGYPTSTGRRTLEDLDAYGIVKRSRIGSGKEDKWRLDKSIYTLLDTFPEKSEWVCTEGVTGGVGMAGELFKHPIPMTDDISGTVDFRHTGQQVTAEKRIPGNSSSIPEREPGDDPEDFTPTGMPDDPIDF